jgi:hypothetical protein
LGQEKSRKVQITGILVAGGFPPKET